MNLITAIKGYLEKMTQIKKCRNNLIELCKRQGYSYATQDIAIAVFNLLVENGYNHGYAINRAIIAAENAQKIIDNSMTMGSFTGVRYEQ